MTKLVTSFFTAGALTFAVSCGGSSDGDTLSPSGGTGGLSGGSAGSSSGSGGSGQSGGSGPSSGGSAQGGGTGGVPIQNVPLELAQVACAKLYECCTPEELMDNLIAGDSEQGCTVAYGAFMALGLAALQPSIEAGRIAYHGDALATCLPQVQATDCATLRAGNDDPAAECDVVFEPLVGIGEPCMQHAECIGGYCDGATDVDGQCAALKSDGAECEDDGECVSDYCDGTCAVEPDTGAFCG